MTSPCENFAVNTSASSGVSSTSLSPLPHLFFWAHTQGSSQITPPSYEMWSKLASVGPWKFVTANRESILIPCLSQKEIEEVSWSQEFHSLQGANYFYIRTLARTHQGFKSYLIIALPCSTMLKLHPPPSRWQFLL